MDENQSEAVASNAELGLSDDDVSRLLPRLKHRPGMIGYECYSFGDVAHAVRAAVAADRERSKRLAGYALSCAKNTEWSAAEDAIARIDPA